MSQPLKSYQWTSLGTVNGGAGAGTVVLADRVASLVRVVIPGTYVGTVSFHDASSAAGTTATSQIVSFGIPNSTVAGNVEVGAQCKNGLVYQATGTPVMTVIWD